MRIAILGGGLLGVYLALELADRGQRVTLIEGGEAVLGGAGRWNEGKVHLGFVYAGDPDMRTARRMIPGALAFSGLLTRLIGRSLDGLTTTDDEVFLVHRSSVVGADAFEAYARRTAALVRDTASQQGAGTYLTDVRRARVRRLSASELAEVTDSEDIVAGYFVPERSVSTVPIADLLRQRVLAEPLVEVRTGIWVRRVARRTDSRFDVVASTATSEALDAGPFDTVINALWEGRPAVDASLGLLPAAPWTHRFRASLFTHMPSANLPSAVICVGPFGDMKRYADGRLYLSWYPAGLLAEGHDLEPPRAAAVLTAARREEVRAGTLQALSRFFPSIGVVDRTADEIDVQGGWVYAIGTGPLADRASGLHRRDQIEFSVDHGYISVDAAKYTLAPWLAVRVADIIAARQR
jgi:glycine/D-amino acid oxidase-like deaminating enzyme